MPASPEADDTQLMGDAVVALLQQATPDLAAVWLDDLQFADAISIRVLARVMAHANAHGLRWLVSSRPEPAEHSPGGLASLAQLPGVQTLALEPLEPAAVAALIESFRLPQFADAGMAQRIVRHTGGNPLFALETLRHLFLSGQPGKTLPAPASVVQLIDLRLQSLSADALQLARVAALAGPDFSVEMAESLLRSSSLNLAEPWLELERACVIRGRQFAHDLVLEGVMRTLPPAIAERCHAQMAEYLAARPRADPARLAGHWDASGAWAPAADAHLRAADQARAACRRDREWMHVHKAERCFDRAGMQTESDEAALRRIDLQRMVQGPAAAVADVEKLLAGPLSAAHRLQALLLLTDCHLSRGQHEAALQAALACEAALQAAPSVENADAWHFRVTWRVAGALGQLGRQSEGLERLDTLLPWVRTQAHARQQSEYFSARGSLLCAGGPVLDAVDAFEAARSLMLRLDDPVELHVLTANASIARLMAGQAEQGLALARAAAEISAQLPGATLSRTVDRANLGLCCLAAGRYAELLDLLQTRHPDGDAASLWALQSESVLGVAWLRLGRPARAAGLLSDPLTRTGVSPLARAMRQLFRLELADAQGRLQAADVDAALDAAQLAGHRLIGVLAAAFHARFQSAEAAIESLSSLRAAAQAHGSPVPACLAAVELAVCLVRAQRHEAALAMASDARAQLNEMDFGLAYKPAVWLKLARCFSSLGAESQAAACLESGRAWAREKAGRQLPGNLLDSFRTNNPVHLALKVDAVRVGHGDQAPWPDLA